MFYQFEETKFTWPSPAKLNLFLHINGKRADGYHELQTLFQLLDWGDDLIVETKQSDQITIEAVETIPAEENLIYRAAQLLKTETKCSFGAHISLDKRIPMGGGLGGGSSNAATALVALNAQWKLNLTAAELQKLGLKLGADVPIFVAAHTSFAEGVGEIIQPVSLPDAHYLIIHPQVHVSTVAAFSSPELKRNSAKISFSDYTFSNTRNDFEPVVKSLFPEVAKAFDWLIEYAPTRLTGTGACVFAQFSDRETAESVRHKVPNCWNAYTAKGVNQSPLMTRLNEFNTHN